MLPQCRLELAHPVLNFSSFLPIFPRGAVRLHAGGANRASALRNGDVPSALRCTYAAKVAEPPPDSGWAIRLLG